MNSLVIPPSPNWYETNVLACAPDNTVAYGALNTLVVIHPKPADQPADVKLIPFAHFERISAVVFNQNWGNPKKLAVTAGDDKIIKLWDVDTCTTIANQKAHMENKSKLIGATFAGDDRVISVSEDGMIVMWRVSTNEVTPIKHLLGLKIQVTCISSCPHAAWLTAFGLKNGLVVVCDMRRTGSVKYKLRSHTKGVASLSWCPLSFNMLPTTKKQNKPIKRSDMVQRAVEKNEPPKVELENQVIPADDNNKSYDVTTTQSISHVEANNTSETVKPKKINPWINLKHADDDEVEPEENVVIDFTGNDFLRECLALKAKIMGGEEKDVVEPEEPSTPVRKEDRKILKARSKKTLDVQDDDGLVERFSEKCDITNDVDNENGSHNEVKSDLKEENVDVVKSEDTKEELQTVEEVVEDEPPPKEFLLASSSRDSTICIWRAGTDGRMQLVIDNLALKQSKGRSKNSQQNKDAWIALYWLSPTVLLSSSSKGQLLQWDLSQKSPQFKVVHSDHTTNLFVISAPVCHRRTLEDLETINEFPVGAWSFGQDQMLLYTSMDANRETLACYSTFGHSVCSIVASPVDPNKIAFGAGGGTIRVLDLSRPHTQYIMLSKINLKVHAKVLVLAWHPSQEQKLAYGTAEGQVGLISTSSTSKAPTLFSQYFRSPIYKLEWGPLKDQPDNLGLYVCSEGTIGVYDPQKPLEDPYIILFTDKEFVTQIAWKEDQSMMAAGTKGGSIHLFSKDLELLGTLHYQKKAIACLAWHPLATASDEDEVSPCSSWLTSTCTTDYSIVVYDLKSFSRDGNIGDSIVCELQTHTKVIQSLSWSSHNSGMLVSLSEDGLAIVWDVVKKEMISTFFNVGLNRLNAGIWSPLDKNHIICAGAESSLQIWNIEDHPAKTKEEIEKVCKERKSAVQEAKSHAKQQTKDDEIKLLSKTKKIVHTPVISVASNRQHETSVMLDDCRKLVTMKTLETDRDEFVNTNAVLQVYGTGSDVERLLNHQQKQHKERGKFSMYTHIALWKGDVAEAIKDAIKTRELTSWLVNIAPTVSPKLWQEACEVYASQLSESAECNPLEVSSYYLACHKMDKAVEILCEHGYFNEALTIVKSRMPGDTASVGDILEKAAKYYTVCGRYELAAQSYIVLDKFEAAAQMLHKRSDLESLELAVELVNKCDNEDLQKAILYSYECAKEATAKKDAGVDSLNTRMASMLLQKDCDTKSYGDTIVNELVLDIKIQKSDETVENIEVVEVVEGEAVEVVNESPQNEINVE